MGLRSLPTSGVVIYSIFVRQFSQEGTFKKVTEDLERISDLGVTHIWLLPIHPIGVDKRKGSLGSPYAIQDYKGINPEYGEMDDFKELLETAHDLDLKVLIDCVFNHTSPDSELAKAHPDWFYQDAKGKPCTRFSDWSDVVDLKYFTAPRARNTELWEYLIECILFWLDVGVDGFRCDVAATVPVEFWLKARTKAAEKFPSRKSLWIAESFSPSMMRDCRLRGVPVASDSALYKVFDACYSYDIFKIYSSCIREREDLAFLFDVLRFQEALSDPDQHRLRFVDNHDQPRVFSLVRSEGSARAWLCMTAFLQGPLLLYQGVESGEKKRNSLFEKDPVDWKDFGESKLIENVCALKSQMNVIRGFTHYLSSVPIACIVRRLGGVFDVFGLNGGTQDVPIPDGTYENLLGGEVTVDDGMMSIEDLPFAAAIVHYKGPIDLEEPDSRFE